MLKPPYPSKPKDIGEQYEKQLNEIKEAYGKDMLEVQFLKAATPSLIERRVVERFVAKTAEECNPTSINKARELAGISRRTYHHEPTRRKLQINEFLAHRVRRVIDVVPYVG